MPDKPRVFLSYVRESAHIAKYLFDVLRANGLDPFLDTNDLGVGVGWKRQLEKAVRTGDFYLPIFTRAWADREKTQANEELLWAVEELRQRPDDKAWFVPLVVDPGSFQDRDIGGGRRLSEIQYADVPNLGWKTALGRLLKAMGVEDPVLDPFEPLAAGFGSAVRATGGHFTVDEIVPPMPVLSDLEFQLSEGLVYRDGDRIIGDLLTRSPNAKLEEVNRLFGMNELYAVSDAPEISRDPATPTRFISRRQHTLPRGLHIPAMLGNPEIQLPMDIHFNVEWTADGYLDGTRFLGTFSGLNAAAGFSYRMRGRFELEIEDAVGPTPEAR